MVLEALLNSNQPTSHCTVAQHWTVTWDSVLKRLWWCTFQ